MEPKPQQHFTFYEYLMFFWSKKRILLMIPLLCIIGALIFSLFQKKVYEGEVVFYVTEHLGDRYTNAEVVTTEYRKHLPAELQSGFQAIVIRHGQMSIQLTGNDQKTMQTHFKKVAELYYADLKKASASKKKMMLDYHETLKKHVTDLKSILSRYEGKLATAQGTDLELIIHTEEELSLAQEKLQVSELQLDDYTEPNVVKPVSMDQIEITSKGTPYLGNLLISGLAGLCITILLLVLWKYIEDAKAASRRKD